MRVYLVGYMGVGKSTLGKKLAKGLNLSFVDLDSFIEEKYQKTIVNIIEQDGENYFRSLEASCLKEVGALENVLISTGGGTPTISINREFMLKNGLVVYLEMNSRSLFHRLKNARHNRPLLKEKNEEELQAFIIQHLNERKPFYSQAHITWNALHNDAQGILELSQLIRNKLH